MVAQQEHTADCYAPADVVVSVQIGEQQCLKIWKKEKHYIATPDKTSWTRNLSNSEKYDNAILTLSTGILAISLAFIKDIVPLNKALYVFLL